ncbi:MAG: hypothetical protein ACREQA_08905 [Candidatus Binatia bacterium]
MSYAVPRGQTDYRLLSEEAYVPADPQSPYRPLLTGSTQLLEARWHYYLPISRQCQSIAERFRELVQAWKPDIGHLSSATQMAMHPAYQQIIGLGREAVPLILRELRREPDHWFWALKAITGVDPVEPNARGRVREMTTAWLRWGEEQGLL